MRAAAALAFVAALTSATALANTPSAGSLADRTTKDGSARHSATVVVFNRPIVRFRAPVLRVPVEERAQNADDRIRTLRPASTR